MKASVHAIYKYASAGQYQKAWELLERKVAYDAGIRSRKMEDEG